MRHADRIERRPRQEASLDERIKLSASEAVHPVEKNRVLGRGRRCSRVTWQSLEIHPAGVTNLVLVNRLGEEDLGCRGLQR